MARPENWRPLTVRSSASRSGAVAEHAGGERPGRRQDIGGPLGELGEVVDECRLQRGLRARPALVPASTTAASAATTRPADRRRRRIPVTAARPSRPRPGQRELESGSGSRHLFRRLCVLVMACRCAPGESGSSAAPPPAVRSPLPGGHRRRRPQSDRTRRPSAIASSAPACSATGAAERVQAAPFNACAAMRIAFRSRAATAALISASLAGQSSRNSWVTSAISSSLPSRRRISSSVERRGGRRRRLRTSARAAAGLTPFDGGEEPRSNRSASTGSRPCRPPDIARDRRSWHARSWRRFARWRPVDASRSRIAAVASIPPISGICTSINTTS